MTQKVLKTVSLCLLLGTLFVQGMERKSDLAHTPNEIFYEIVSHLSENQNAIELLRSLVSLRTTCKKINTTLSNENLQKLNLAPPKLETLFFEQVETGNTHNVNYLLDLGVNINSKDRWGNTALMVALGAKKNKLEIAQLLLDRNIAIETKTNGFTALITATMTKEKEIVQLLLDRGANAQATDNENKTAYDWAKDDDIAALLRKHQSE